MNRKGLLTALVAVAALVTSGAVASPSPPPGETTTPMERVSAYTEPSIVYIQLEWTGRVYDRFNKLYLKNGNPFREYFQCTGSVVNSDGYISTAGHCVDPDEVEPYFLQDAAQWALDNDYYVATDLTLDEVLGFGDYVVVSPDSDQRAPDLTVTTAWSVSAGGVETGKALPARVAKRQTFDKGDAALLKVEADNLNALPISEDTLEIGTEIVTIGYPTSVDLVTDADFTPSYKNGSVSSEKTVGDGLLTVYEISAAVSGGMSGGPTVSLDSEIVGFNSFKINQEVETQQFNFVRPADAIQEVLADAGTTNELSQDSLDYRAGLDAYFAGDKELAVEKLQSVVDSQPTHEMAQLYLDKAEDLPDSPGPSSGEGSEGTGIVLVLGGVALAVVVVGGLLLLLLRRRRGSAGPAPAAAGPAPVVADPAPPPRYGPAATTPDAGASSTTLRPAAPSRPTGTGTAVRTTPVPAQKAWAAEPDDVFCPDCGARHGPEQKFCRHCGTPLVSGGQES